MIGCLCIHGFTGSPFEVEPLGNFLKENTSWIVETPTLPGHGGELARLRGVAYQDWVQEAEQSLQGMLAKCSTVYLVGFSMGGVISGYLATKYPVKKLVLLSAAAYYINPKQLLQDIKEMAAEGMRGTLGNNDLFQRYRKKIKETPLTATFQFQRLVKELRPTLSQIEVPTLIVQGELDGIVPVKSASFLYNTIPSNEREIVYLPKSKHLVCHDEDRDQLFTTVEKFLIK
ncbi:alpha/beta fold hydrolase [Schinkia azotoformans]|uniref:Esterase n=1 Tax=Schinkia azotoformans LMG 9581 TaxID=1131731 RepID=K6E4Q5_SCHAZ|nr:alpha/beta fold hydrolase [Schinkia azotoformans]EKN68231.1 esterase [Schinkia azotoformans LMG 9581]MEC1639605.1 alpha/beta fold hydrolase [Schinkia azotoformans]MEC1722410.1 alpha/beta fold hydrolase [Schinkia azotoformans]MEC1947368.1 alpha/beta fold hydrolase [Schinkia azotoformans]MED4414784.1 alpha/beta fold hydrolase [Schinkia azotoformans]